MSDTTFSAFIDAIADRPAYGGSLDKLAKAIGMTYSALKRAIDKGTLNIDNLLRLSIETGEPPARIFKLANKLETLRLLEQVYTPTDRVLSSTQRRVLALFNGLPDDEARAAFLALLTAFPSGPTTMPSAHGLARRSVRSSGSRSET